MGHSGGLTSNTLRVFVPLRGFTALRLCPNSAGAELVERVVLILRRSPYTKEYRFWWVLVVGSLGWIDLKHPDGVSTPSGLHRVAARSKFRWSGISRTGGSHPPSWAIYEKAPSQAMGLFRIWCTRVDSNHRPPGS